MTAFLFNPGTGPVERATLDRAYENLAALLKEAGSPDARYRRHPEAKEDGGRFCFLIKCPPCDGHQRGWECVVYMPGCSLRRLKGAGLEAPRLYVDGSSWWWKYAVESMHRCLFPEDDDL